MERRMELLPRWLFSTPTRLQHLRLHGATTFGGWPGRMLERVSRLRALETASFEFMHIDDGVVASLARLPRLRELELGMEEGACWPWVAPLRSCTALTRLALVVRDSCSRQQVASQVAQVGQPQMRLPVGFCYQEQCTGCGTAARCLLCLCARLAIGASHVNEQPPRLTWPDSPHPMPNSNRSCGTCAA